MTTDILKSTEPETPAQTTKKRTKWRHPVKNSQLIQQEQIQREQEEDDEGEGDFEDVLPNKRIAQPPPGASLLLLATISEASAWVAQFQADLNDQLDKHTLGRPNFPQHSYQQQMQPLQQDHMLPQINVINEIVSNTSSPLSLPSASLLSFADVSDPSSFSFSAASQLSTILNASLSQSLLTGSLSNLTPSTPFVPSSPSSSAELISSSPISLSPSHSTPSDSYPSSCSSSCSSGSSSSSSLFAAPSSCSFSSASQPFSSSSCCSSSCSPSFPSAACPSCSSSSSDSSPSDSTFLGQESVLVVPNTEQQQCQANQQSQYPQTEHSEPQHVQLQQQSSDTGLYFQQQSSSEWINPLLAASFQEELARLVAEDQQDQPPALVSWEDDIYPVEVDDIVGRRSKLPKRAVVSLQRWFDENMYRPYPSDCSKHQLAYETGLTAVQLNHWFTNTRKRYWLPQVKQLQDNGVALTKEASAFVVMPWHDPRKSAVPLML